jgi:uncharacterized protein (DUF983 family)
MPDDEPFNAPKILNPSGKPARDAVSTACPRCGSDKRVLSGGFGNPHDVCGNCGYEWAERTIV